MSGAIVKGLLKLIGYLFACSVVMGVVLAVFTLFGNVDAENENAAYHAVLDYASNKSIGLPSGDPDKMIVKPFKSEGCSRTRQIWGLRRVQIHDCWLVEYPTTFNTYRWLVDLRDPQKVRRRGLEHGTPVWVEVYEYKVKRLPPFDSLYPQSEDWNE